MAVVRGKDFKLYRNSDDPYDSSPTWNLVDNIKNLKRNKAKALADASIRGSEYRQQVGTLKDLNLDFQMVYDPADTDLLAFEEAYEDDTNVEVLVLDGSIDTTGSKGVRFMAQIVDFTINEDLEDVGLVDVKIVVGYDSTNPPRRVHVTTPGGVVDL